jgi:GH15 family glucan-1,4-alpha-glucosidase
VGSEPASSTFLPIGDYALLSDCHSAALVSRGGSVDWLCFPRFDSPSLCGRLLSPEAGHWAVAPAGTYTATRRYLDRTLVLETTFRTPTGVATLVDALLVGALDEAGHELGRGATHTLVRTVICQEGSVDLRIELAARPDYGRVVPALAVTPDGAIVHQGAAGGFALSSTVALEIVGGDARARVRLRGGERLALALRYLAPDSALAHHGAARAIDAELDTTIGAWRAWSDVHDTYDGLWRDQVLHSGRVLQALTYYPTGAIVAAPTTSLPEQVGASRNWDYRYAWVRDASFTLRALWIAGCPDQAVKFFEFLAGAALADLEHGDELQTLFGIAGEHDLTERELRHLSGWRESRPVRVGNAAWTQRQLDVYGELLLAAAVLSHRTDVINARVKRLLVEAANLAASRWTELDHSVWEIRGAPRDYLYSTLMCWVAVDRAIELAEMLGAPERVPTWSRARDAIRAAILARGWNDRARAFTQAFGSEAIDASSLMIPIVGFLPSTDRRVRATVETVIAQLADARGLVYRYRGGDDLSGREGPFVPCTFWLAQALALAGRIDDAKATFERTMAFANDVGLLSEEVDPETSELLGNFPQAISHVGLVNAALAITEAERGAAHPNRRSPTGSHRS